MQDTPRTITIDLSKRPEIAALLTALHMTRETQRVAHEKQYEAAKAQDTRLLAMGPMEGGAEQQRLMASGEYAYCNSTPPEKLDLNAFATTLFEQCLVMHLRSTHIDIGGQPQAITPAYPRPLYRPGMLPIGPVYG